jgi:CarboxypepD_reg-like domain/TonB-dependent Receptor Plug Domain/Secretin and TonB N terminus short domain
VRSKNKLYICPEFQVNIYKLKRSQILIFMFFLLSTLAIGQIRPDHKIISYTCYDRSLIQVLKDLNAVSGINIIYSESRLPKNQKKITVNANKEKLGDVLNVALKEHQLTFQIVGNQLVIVKMKEGLENAEFIIYGHVRDKTSGEYLAGANVFLHDHSRGTFTNDKGFFSLKVRREPIRLHVTYLGYKPESKDIEMTRDSTININLMPDGLLNEIVILDNLLDEEKENASSAQFLHIDKIRSSNHLGGEPDLFRYLGMQAGVSGAADGIGGINVRGGSADQNLVLLDGIPIYNTGHALGLFSVLDANAIKNVSFYKGGIPARFGGRLSSVIDVQTKDGNYNKITGEATVSTIAAKASIEGPIVRDKGSFIVSFRRTFMDLWLKEITKSQYNARDLDGATLYAFHDLSSKINYKIGKNTRIHFNFLQSGDQFDQYSRQKDDQPRDEKVRDISWKNRLMAFKLNQVLSKNMYLNTTLYQTQYQFVNYTSNLNFDKKLFFDASLQDSGIRENGIKTAWDWLPSPSHSVKAGVGFFDRKYAPLALQANEGTFKDSLENISESIVRSLHNTDNLKNQEIQVFVEDNMNLSQDIQLNLGLNYTAITNTDGKNNQMLQPRIALLASGESLYFKAGASRMMQPMHVLNSNSTGFFSEMWLPITAQLEPQKSWLFHSSIGYKNNSGYKSGMEVYYKTFDGLSLLKEGSVFEVTSDQKWENLLPIGTGYAYGLEIYFEKVTGKTLFNLNYSYSISDRVFDDINVGRRFSFDFNRVHNFKAAFTYRISEFSEFLLNWSYLSGNPYSSPLSVTFSANGRPAIIYPEKNNSSFPVYHRLDVGFTFYNNFKWCRAKFFVGVYNAYGRKNPFYTEIVKSESNDNRFEFQQLTLIPIFPSLSYSIAF